MTVGVRRTPQLADTVPVPTSTWRVVLTSDTGTLFQTVSGMRKWLPWILFIALGIVGLGFLGDDLAEKFDQGGLGGPELVDSAEPLGRGQQDLVVSPGWQLEQGRSVVSAMVEDGRTPNRGGELVGPAGSGADLNPESP